MALVTAMAAEARGLDLPPSIGVRSQDRVTLAAGAVLGALAFAILGMARRAAVTVIRGGDRQAHGSAGGQN